MGVFRLYAQVAQRLLAHPNMLVEAPLERIAAAYSPFAYIGSRRLLADAVREHAARLQACQAAADPDALAAWWYGRSSWQTDSGAFPDFVLAWEGKGILGDGALLELKDSRNEALASFNSTLPSARKSIQALTVLVRDAVARYESCTQPGPDERDCFYLVRTHRSNPQMCRMSLVQGTFFETVPTAQLLAALWKEVLGEANVPDELQEQLKPYLSRLDREDIARTRQIDGASVKPRLRIMGEVHSEGNPHTYPEIAPRSVNLVVKLPDEIASLPDSERVRREGEQWMLALFQSDEVPSELARQVGQTKLVKHQRNGWHLVKQVLLPERTSAEQA